MIAAIDRRATGVRLRRLMDDNNFTVSQLRDELNLASVQSVYHWLNGITLPTLDNLYAMSGLFGVPMDDMICGSLIRPDRRKPAAILIEAIWTGGICADYRIEI